MKILGVGIVSAFALLALISDIGRFHSPEKLVAYIGKTLRVSPTYSHVFPAAGCFWVLGLWYAVRRDFLSRRHQDTEGFSGNGASDRRLEFGENIFFVRIKRGLHLMKEG
jgi:hypothetical protein